jgi:hypothetical protein
LFADIAKTPAAQTLARRLETGGALLCAGICVPAQPFFAALLQTIFPTRPIVIVAPDLKTQENFQQDLETWIAQRPSANAHPLFYPAWEIFRTKTSCRTPMSSATACKRSSRSLTIQNAKFKTQNCRDERHRAAAKNLCAGEI